MNAAHDHELIRRIHADLADSYDEELELELEDRTVDAIASGGVIHDDEVQKEARRRYFRELFRLQGELVKLSDDEQHLRFLGRIHDPMAYSRTGSDALR